MTEEELKQKAKDYANDWLWFVKGLEIVHKTDPKPEYIRIEEAYIAGAEPREKQIEIDAEQIRALQKQNGELTDKVKDLEAKLKKETAQRIYNFNKSIEWKEKHRDLEAQIEKMKKELDNARENANKQEQWEIYSVLNDIYNDNFEVITSVSN